MFGNEKYLYDPKRDFKPASRSLNLHEDLGQIKYIFSDKTGTLTKNKMILQTLAVGHDVSTIFNYTNAQADFLPQIYSNDEALPNLEIDDDWKSLAPIANSTFLWNDTWLIGRLKSLAKAKDRIENDPLYLVLLTLALCHSANVFDKHVDETTGMQLIKGDKVIVLTTCQK